jgi:phenylacetate-CoA ligase
MSAFAERVRRQKPRILFGYTSSLHRFAQFVQGSPYQGLTFDGVFVGGELLFPAVRESLEETFGCRVFNHYGTNELGGVACECEAHRGLHIATENNFVEILSEGYPAEPGTPGDLIVTNLNNLGMPFIRYSIGDGGVWLPDELCPCGRASPQLKSVDGRRADTFKTRDGRTLWTAFTGAAFRCLAHPAIRQFQVVQKSLDRIVVRLVWEGDVSSAALDAITQAMQAVFGERVAVDYEFPTDISLLPSGKHQYAMSELNYSH